MTAVSYVRGIIPDAINREKDDFYPTPPEGTRALLRAEKFEGAVWEPACGDGAMSREIEAAGYQVVSSDLVDRGYGESRIDFLMECDLRAPNVVTNPPFKHAQEFVEHALWLGAEKVCVLARLAWLEGIERRKLFESTPLARVLVFSKRLRMWRGNEIAPDKAGSMIAFAWYIWRRGYAGPPTLGWINPEKETTP